MATADTTDIDQSSDFCMGRSGNWRSAPSDWSVYNPDHDDYQRPGRCRRYIARSLNLRSRIACLQQEDIDLAFERAEEGLDSFVGFCSHDWRDLEPEIMLVLGMIRKAATKYPDVPYKYSQAKSAFYAFLSTEQKYQEQLLMSVEHIRPESQCSYLKIKTLNGSIFGPQPFLAIKTKAGNYIHDNLDFSQVPGEWFYPFHMDTLPLHTVDTIGIAANDIQGNTYVHTIKF